MRDAVRDHFANPPPGSKLRAAIDFGVDISLMAPPDYSDRGGNRAWRNFGPILAALHERAVDFIVIGGAALILHGSTRLTFDIDIVYDRRPENIARLVAALRPFRPRLRLPKPNLPTPFVFDERTLRNGGDFTLVTDDDFEIDLLASTDDLPSYPEVLAESIIIETVPGMRLNVLSLDALLRIKQRLNRVKDQLAVPEIEALIEIRDLERGSN
jgi:predicted nucleotidyltransferase